MSSEPKHSYRDWYIGCLIALLIYAILMFAAVGVAHADPLGDRIKQGLNTFWKQTGDKVRAKEFNCLRGHRYAFVCHGKFVMLGSPQPPVCVVYHIDGHYRVVGKPQEESCVRTS